MAAHIWLGVAALPLAIVHCGFHLGGWLPTTFMALLVLTTLSGMAPDPEARDSLIGIARQTFGASQMITAAEKNCSGGW